MTRMYKMEITKYPDGAIYEWDEGAFDINEDWEPEGWQEYSEEKFGAYKPFFWPKQNKLYQSRSAAQSKVDIVRRWGGEAIILEAELSEFIPVQEANKRRKQKTLLTRLEKAVDKAQNLRDQIAALEVSNG